MIAQLYTPGQNRSHPLRPPVSTPRWSPGYFQLSSAPAVMRRAAPKCIWQFLIIDNEPNRTMVRSLKNNASNWKAAPRPLSPSPPPATLLPSFALSLSPAPPDNSILILLLVDERANFPCNLTVFNFYPSLVVYRLTRMGAWRITVFLYCIELATQYFWQMREEIMRRIVPLFLCIYRCFIIFLIMCVCARVNKFSIN